MRGEVAAVGTERVTPQGYLLVKTEDGWKLKQKIVMEKKLGRPIKVTERIYFLDGNKQNCDIDNLEVRIIKPSSLVRLEKRLEKVTEMAEGIRQEMVDRSEVASEATENSANAQ